MSQPKSNEAVYVRWLCLLAALRVFIYCAGFPLFSNIDEPRHLDLVLKYSQGHVPRKLETWGADGARYVTVCGSPEYLNPRKDLPDGKVPTPPWLLPPEKAGPAMVAEAKSWRHTPNSETTQPPLYYALAAVWLRVGQVCGFESVPLMYWLRFSNLLLAAGLVWIGYAVARDAFPEHRSVRLGVPLLLAVLPQDAFYAIENDTLSPLAFGLLLLYLLRFLQTDVPGKKLGALTGLAFAATYLVKLSNVPLLAVAGMVLLARIWRLYRNGRLRAALPSVSLLALCAVLPIAGWMTWCLVNYGDPTGSADKMKLLTWTSKPFAAWWHHPMFTLPGFWIFVRELLASFWRGEFCWFGRVLASPGADLFYIFSSLLFPALALIGLRTRSAATPSVRQVVGICFVSLLAMVLFFAWLSISLDFGDCFYPSREYPYFTSGRLLSGALIPFAVVYLYGLERALSWTKRRCPLLVVLAAIVLVTTGSEIIVNRVAFVSDYNWFHFWSPRSELVPPGHP